MPSRSGRVRKRTALSLFSGPGGMDLGLERAGWTVLAQIELDPESVETLNLESERRGSSTRVIAARIEDVDPGDLRDGLRLAQGELELMAGGPPCQPFTTHGLRQAARDPRVESLFPSYFRFVDAFQPRALLLENVDGFLSASLRHRPLAERGKDHDPLAGDEEKGSFLRWFVDQLRDLGYAVSWGVVEAAEYGVPQFRQRAVLIGVRGNDPCFLPPPSYGGRGQPAYRTLEDGLANVDDPGPIQPLSERKVEVYRRIPPGGNWRDLPPEDRADTMGRAYEAEGGLSGWWRRLAWEKPAPTILGMPDHSSTGLIHPDEVRCLSVNECAALQTFPPEFRFAGRPRSQYQQIGNAVPPLLAEHLGKRLMAFLDGDRTPIPAPPVWRRESANRRIGTHGWALPAKVRTPYHLIVRVREDHVWALGAKSRVSPAVATATGPTAALLSQ
jgi:DNA (cytosine-5)-methyltransferase 1